ncbi:PAS domain-containing sensor histidine kinase [Flavisolibacter tropicus]|uniref:histidine kinase n=1 Tax=Flavisolibacter tropicus TaxID=1492898 RepID=A0A172TW77_9BACT|nr:PAS domain S-box protein [Flavisolibacter tropicus]ANE51280.1 hypothetical protein SY85_12930 [Flavisolibacter tropicus]
MAGPSTFNQFDKLLDSIAEVVCVIDKDFRFVYVNQACEEMWGYQPEELIGRPIFQLIVNIDRAATQQAIEQFWKDGESYEFENEYCHKDGSVIAMSWIGKKDSHNKLIYARGKNVIQKRMQEKEVEMLSLIARETVNGIVIMDAQRRISWINKAFADMTGFAIEEIKGKRPAEFLCGLGTDIEHIQEIIRKVQRGEAATIEMLGYTKERLPIWAAIQLQPLFDKTGGIDKIVAIINNITERKRLQEQLDAELKQQQQRITAAVIRAQETERSQLGRELHDNVNQVLTTVKLFNEIIAESVTDHKELLKRSSNFLQMCIDEIRRISKRLAIPPLSEVGLVELTRELVDSINLASKFEVTYSLKGMHAIPISQELQLAIYRIMQEQLNNIIKHAEASMVMIALAYEDDQLFLTIKDNGRGFDPSIKRDGIGLTNIRSRAESLNGSFHLQTASGRGCYLQVAFPLDKVEVLS